LKDEQRKNVEEDAFETWRKTVKDCKDLRRSPKNEDQMDDSGKDWAESETKQEAGRKRPETTMVQVNKVKRKL
jgi:hypothetical protein